MKIIFWGAVILLGYSYYKKQSITQTLQSLLSGAQTDYAPNLSVTNQSPLYGTIPSAAQTGAPGTPAGSLSGLIAFIRQNESGGPYAGALLSIQ